MSEGHDSTIRPRRISRRGVGVLAAFIVAFAVAWLTVLSQYNAEGGSRVESQLSESGESGIVITIDPVTLSAQTGEAVVRLRFGGSREDLVDADGRLLQNVRVAIDSFVGSTEVRWPAGTTPRDTQATIGLDGEPAKYPFDAYSAWFFVTADTYTRASDGSLTSTGNVPVGLLAGGGVNGWDTTFTLYDKMGQSATAELDFNRAFSTQAFALLILTMTIVLSLLSLLVGVLVFTRRRSAEVALLSWTAALLFALPLLRNYMPNSPPIGAAIDAYIYLWVIGAAVIGNVLVIIGWMNQRRDALSTAIRRSSGGGNGA